MGDTSLGDILLAALRPQGFAGFPVGEDVRVSREVVGTLASSPAQTLADFRALVDAAREFVSAQDPNTGQSLGEKLESISNRGGGLAVAAGRAATLAGGIVTFHEEISRGKPALRRALRKIDEKAGRRIKFRRTPVQKLITLGVRAGRMRRNKTGQFTAPDAVLKGLINRAKTRAASERRKRDIERQKKFDAKLRDFAKKIVLPSISGAKRRRT